VIGRKTVGHGSEVNGKTVSIPPYGAADGICNVTVTGSVEGGSLSPTRLRRV